MRVSVGVVTEGPSADQAAESNAAKTKAVLTAVQGLRLKDLKLKTTRYQVQPQWDYERKPPKLVGYQVHNTVEVTWEQAESAKLALWVPRIIQAALANGANSMDELAFYRQDRSALEQQALGQATEQALAKAKVVARAAGVRLRRIATLTTQPTEVPPVFMPPRALAFGAAAEKQLAPPVEAGESKVGARVTLAYEIE